MDKETKENIKEDLKNLADAAKKVSKTASEISAEELEVVKEKTKTTVKKGTTKIKDLFKTTKVHSFVQIDNMEIVEDEIIEKIKTVYKEEGNTDVVKELNLYIKPQEHAVYYVVNGTVTGKIDI